MQKTAISSHEWAATQRKRAVICINVNTAIATSMMPARIADARFMAANSALMLESAAAIARNNGLPVVAGALEPMLRQAFPDLVEFLGQLFGGFFNLDAVVAHDLDLQVMVFLREFPTAFLRFGRRLPDQLTGFFIKFFKGLRVYDDHVVRHGRLHIVEIV